MSGAATVLGLMQAIADAKLPVNVRGYMGLVENMISGRAYRLGDVLTARNGVTIEVMNTDAEGRLVLADVLSFAVDEGCEKLVDLATLTGSCVVALGEDYAGLFTNEQSWAEEVLAAAKSAGELVWQLRWTTRSLISCVLMWQTVRTWGLAGGDQSPPPSSCRSSWATRRGCISTLPAPPS